MRKRTVIANFMAILLSGALLSSGCASGGKGANSPGKELNVGAVGVAQTMDPQKSSDSSSIFCVDPFVGRLYREDEKGGVLPDLAEGYEVSEDGKTYTFTLLSGIRYSNGEPIKAKDFVYGMRRLADPEVGSSAVFLITDSCKVRNAKEVNEGKLPPEELGVKAPDDRTFVMELEAPCPFLTFLLSKPNFSPCDEDFVKKCGAKYGTSPETILSSGPFYVDRYEPMGIQTHYSPNPYYIHRDSVKLSGINIQQVADVQQGQMVYRAGGIDIVAVVREYRELSEGDTELLSRTGGQIAYLEGNFDRCEAWKNKNIRLALSKATDRESLVRNYYKGCQPLYGLVPATFALDPDGSDYVKDPGRYEDVSGYDPAEAREYLRKGLEELGVEEITFNVIVQSGKQDILEILKNMYETNLPGVHIEFKTMPFGQYLETRTKGDFEMSYMGWAADYPDPDAFLQLVKPGAQGNLCRYDNDEFASVFEKSEREMDPVKRSELLHEAEDIAMNDIAILPIYAKGGDWLIADNIDGAFPDFGGMVVHFAYAEKR